MYIALI